MEKIRFTKTAVMNIGFSEKQIRYADASTPFLQLWVSKNQKTFYYVRKIKNTQYNRSIGRFPECSVEMAREKAELFSGRVAAYGCLDAISSKVKASFGEVYQNYLGQLKAPATIRQAEWVYNHYLRVFADKPLVELSRRDFRELHEEITKKGKATSANRIIAYARAAINYAIKKDVFPGPNPAIVIEFNREAPRRRFVRVNEMPEVLNIINSLSGHEQHRDAIAAIKAMLFTGARKDNVLSMEWSELDLDNKEWVIPADKAKAQNEIRLPLVDEVVEILSKRKHSGKYVFPSKKSGSEPPKTPYMTEVRATWRLIKERSGCPDLHLHDLRRTLGSWQVAGGSPMKVISRSLGHSSTAVTDKVYTELDLEPVRQSVQRAVSSMKGVKADKRNPETALDAIRGIVAVAALDDNVKVSAINKILENYDRQS